MELKGSWGKVIGWPLAVAALVGQSFIGYVTENGQLPPWMPEKLGGLASWLSTDISIPVWSLVLILVCISTAATLFVKLQSRTSKAQEIQIAGMATDLLDANKRCSLLEVKNANLKQQVLSKPQPPAPALALAPPPVKIELPAIANLVLKAIALCNVKNIKPTISMIASMTDLDAMEIHVTTDILIECKFLKMHLTHEGDGFALTVEGRAYYVSNKE